MTTNNHGDLVLYPIASLTPPDSAIKSKLHILQDSGPTGNRHEIVSKKNLIYRWIQDGVEYIHCDIPYIIQHVGGDQEHGFQQVEAGTRKVLHEMEYNPWGKELRVVID